MAEVMIWTEKYRPKTFKEVKGQDKIVKRVEAFVKQKNMLSSPKRRHDL